MSWVKLTPDNLPQPGKPGPYGEWELAAISMPASPKMVARLKGLIRLSRARRSFCAGEKHMTSGPVTKRVYQLKNGACSTQTVDSTAVEPASRVVSPTPRTETPRQ